MPLHIAAVVVNYGTLTETVQCIGSLARSGRRCDQVLVVDNGSADDVTERLRQALPHARVLSLPRNLGFSGGANTGIREALAQGADAVLLLNSDAQITPEALSLMEQALTGSVGLVGPTIVQQSNPALVECAGIRYAARTGRMRLRGWNTALARSPRERIEVDALSGCAMLVRREVFEQVGLFDERYFFSFEDVDLCLRARERGFRSVCVAEAIVVHKGSLSIGPGSPRRHYYAARNHLLLARERTGPAVLRPLFIVGLNALHAARFANGRTGRLAAVARGVKDYLRGQFGPA